MAYVINLGQCCRSLGRIGGQLADGRDAVRAPAQRSGSAMNVVAVGKVDVGTECPLGAATTVNACAAKLRMITYCDCHG